MGEQCQRCGKAPAVRTLGTVAHCRECAERFLAPIRRRQPVVRLYRATAIRPAYDGMAWMQCNSCEATWVGHETEPCQWCIARDERMSDDERNALLFPAWAVNGYGPKYETLSDVDKAIWRRTRGQRHDADTVVNWLHDLSAGVVRGVVTDEDAERAIERVMRDHES